jgi:RsiW-degrading membrane proteinase PrsW (M82 family)
MSLTIAPIIEELCKGLPLLLFLNTKRYARITKVIIFCAMVSGIGFSVQESMYYFSISSRELSDVGMLIARSLTTALLHGMTTATIGAGLMFFQRQNHIIVPLIITLFAFSSGIHALFNLLLQTKLMIVAMSIPYAMFVAGFAFIEREIPDYSQRT